VADEVLCGYGRAGRPFAIAGWQVTPDIITLGKGIGSGYAPLGAVVIADRIREGFRRGTGRFVHGFTYSGTPSAVFVGLKVLEIMTREGLFTRAAEIGAYLERELHRLAQRHAAIGEIRGRGLLWGIEFVADRATRQPFPAERNFTRRQESFSRGGWTSKTERSRCVTSEAAARCSPTSRSPWRNGTRRPFRSLHSASTNCSPSACARCCAWPDMARYREARCRTRKRRASASGILLGGGGNLLGLTLVRTRFMIASMRSSFDTL
jgi:hypothetical protein